jgi:23S rRNA pseudouridine1911/1915/1917 synthase
MKNNIIKVDTTAKLLNFLIQKTGGMSRSKVKALLKYNQVRINGTIETQFDFELKCGDVVTLDFDKKESFFHPKLKIIYEDDYIIVVDKAVGLLTNKTDNEKEKTAFSIIMNYLKQKDHRNKLFYVHRLDRDTSGVLLFAKSKNAQFTLQNLWHRDENEKIYVALVEGSLEKEFGTIESWLIEDEKSKKVYAYDYNNGGLYAALNYIVINRSKNRTLLQIELLTGRKNQIRAQLQSLGHPIVGDKKYGAKTNPVNRLALHANSLKIIHPETAKLMSFESKVPKIFYS